MKKNFAVAVLPLMIFSLSGCASRGMSDEFSLMTPEERSEYVCIGGVPRQAFIRFHFEKGDLGIAESLADQTRNIFLQFGSLGKALRGEHVELTADTEKSVAHSTQACKDAVRGMTASEAWELHENLSSIGTGGAGKLPSFFKTLEEIEATE